MRALLKDKATPYALGLGIVLMALGRVIDSEFLVLADAAAFIAFGAVFPKAPWRVGGVAAVPAVVAGFVHAVTTSVGTVVMVVVFGPIALLLAAALVRLGSLLVEGDAEAAGLNASPEPPAVSGRRDIFDTKAKRARFLVIIAFVFFGASIALSASSSRSVEAKTEKRVAEIRKALEGHTPDQLTLEYLESVYGGGDNTLPGGPYRAILPSAQDIRATAEVRSGTETRCIHVHLRSDGSLTTETKNRSC